MKIKLVNCGTILAGRIINLTVGEDMYVRENLIADLAAMMEAGKFTYKICNNLDFTLRPNFFSHDASLFGSEKLKNGFKYTRKSHCSTEPSYDTAFTLQPNDVPQQCDMSKLNIEIEFHESAEDKEGRGFKINPDAILKSFFKILCGIGNLLSHEEKVLYNGQEMPMIEVFEKVNSSIRSLSKTVVSA